MGKVAEILDYYGRMSYHAINVSESDLVLGVSFLEEKAKAHKLSFVSANLVYKKTGKPVFAPSVTKQTGNVRVAIIGVMDAPAPPGILQDTYAVQDPAESVRSVANSLKDQANIVILLSSLSKKKNVNLLKELADIDFVISTDKRSHAPIRVKNGYILSSGNKGKYLGMLDITLSSLDRPLELEDTGRKSKLKSSLSWIERKMAQFDNKKEDIFKSDDARIKEKFNEQMQRFKKQRDQYRKELSELNNVHNCFQNKMIPLAARQPEKDIMLSRQGKGTSGSASQVMSPGACIEINTLRDDNGKKITFVLAIDRASNQVRALGFDVVYDSKVLKYSGYTKGELVKKFDMFDASKLRDGLLRVGGFEAREDLIQAGKSGELVKLGFDVIGQGNSDVKLVRLKDDISSWGVEEVQPSYKKNMEIKIESIWSHPETFQGQKVIVRGRYLGWRGQVEHPLITRSDWAIEDETGTIYVTGSPAKGLDPMHDIGHPLQVMGTVRVNPEGVPYIRAEKVIVEEAK